MRKISYSSIIIGILTFGLLGAGVYSGLLRLDLIHEIQSLKYSFIVIGAIFGAYFGFKKPVGTEAWSFAITGLIIFQAGWDIMRDITNSSDPRIITFLIAGGIFLLNTLTGKFRIKTAKKTIRSFLGK